MNPILIILFGYLAGLFMRPALYISVSGHAGYLIYRGIASGRLPIVGVHDTLLLFSFSIALFSLAFGRFMRRKTAFLRFATVAMIIFLAPSLFVSPHDGPLPQVLRTLWFEIHVVLSFFSYALFIVGGMTGVFYLVNDDPETELLQYRAVLIGYTLFSVSMIAGGIWAFYAWGTYWLWTPKEFWTSILWLYYSLYLHLRFHRSFAGRRAARAGVFVVAVMLFTYLGVSVLLKSSHSF